MDAIKTLMNIASRNGKKVDKKQLESIVENLTEDAQNGKSAPGAKSTIFDLFKQSKTTTAVVFRTSFLWIAVSSVYYGISLNSAKLPGDKFINVSLSGLFDLSSRLVLPFLINRPFFGRKKTIIICFFIAAVLCLTNAIAGTYQKSFEENTEEYKKVGMIVALSFHLGKFFVGGVYDTIYQYTGEIYPTQVRNNGVGFGSMAAKLATMLIPFVLWLENWGVWIPGTIFSVFGVAAGLVMFTLPDTYGLPMLQTMEEADRFYKSGKY